MEETIYHNECSCLFADSIKDEMCLKRYYCIHDVRKDEYKTIVICNEHIRLLLHQKIHENKNKSDVDAYIVTEIVREIISKYVNIKDPGFGCNIGNNELINRRVYFEICSRPYMIASLSVRECVINVIEKGKNRTIEERLFQVIKEYLSEEIYKKYKTKYKECFIIMRKIKNTYRIAERNILYNELFIKIYELNINK